MTNLYFLRHGVAHDRDEWRGDSDELRPLTEAGRAAMRHQAVILARLGLKLSAIFSSPLVRARQTADLVAEAFPNVSLIEDPLLKPGFNSEALAKLLKTHRPQGAILLVGHEPDFSEVIAALTDGHVVMKKGGLARVRLATKLDKRELRGELLWLATPELLGAAQV